MCKWRLQVLCVWLVVEARLVLPLHTSTELRGCVVYPVQSLVEGPGFRVSGDGRPTRLAFHDVFSNGSTVQLVRQGGACLVALTLGPHTTSPPSTKHCPLHFVVAHRWATLVLQRSTGDRGELSVMVQEVRQLWEQQGQLWWGDDVAHTTLFLIADNVVNLLYNDCPQESYNFERSTVHKHFSGTVFNGSLEVYGTANDHSTRPAPHLALLHGSSWHKQQPLTFDLPRDSLSHGLNLTVLAHFQPGRVDFCGGSLILTVVVKVVTDAGLPQRRNIHWVCVPSPDLYLSFHRSAGVAWTVYGSLVPEGGAVSHSHSTALNSVMLTVLVGVISVVTLERRGCVTS